MKNITCCGWFRSSTPLSPPESNDSSKIVRTQPSVMAHMEASAAQPFSALAPNISTVQSPTAGRANVERFIMPTSPDLLPVAIKNWQEKKDDASLLNVLGLIKLKPTEKFKFIYQVQSKTLIQKTKEEDDFALKTIHSATAREATFKMARLCAERIELSESDDPEYFVSTLNAFLQEKRGTYPVLKKDFKDMDEVLSFLKNLDNDQDKNKHVKLLSVLWCVSMCISPLMSDLSKEMQQTDEINAIYENLIKPTQDYIEGDKPALVKSNQFGNSKGKDKVSDETFADDDFSPFLRANAYISINDKSTSPKVQNWIKKDTNYGSGLSGMANATCGLLDILKIYPFDEELGKPFCEAMNSYIVGGGMHKRPEVDKALNLYLKLIEARKLRDNF
jgi:hypothetical protein